MWKTQPSWGTGDVLQTTLISASGEVTPHFPVKPRLRWDITEGTHVLLLQEMAMRKVTRTHFEDEDEDMVRATVWVHLSN